MDDLEAIKQAANELRASIKHAGDLVHNELKQAISQSPESPGFDKGEALSNVILAYRHLEDARMRLGKVIQAMEGGVSIYDKP